MGGVEVYVYNLAKALSKDNEVFIFYPVLDEKQKKYTIIEDSYNGLHVYKIIMNDLPKVKYGELYDGALFHQFSKIVEKIKPDVIHYHTLINLSMCLLSPEVRVPKVFTTHDFWIMCPRVFLIRTDNSLCQGPEGGLLCVTCKDHSKGYKTSDNASFLEKLLHFKRRLISYNFENMMFNDKLSQHHLRDDYAQGKAKQVDLFVAPSKLYREIYINWCVEPKKIIHSIYGIDTSKFANFKKIPSEKIRFGFIGRVEKLKGVHLLVSAFNKLEAKNVELKIYGKFTPESYEFEIKSMVKNENIHFMGIFHNDALANVLSEFDVLILPSIVYENCPVVVEEALAVKIPVIVSNMGGAAELVRDGLDGFHFERGNAQSLLEKVRLIIENTSILDKLKTTMNPVKTAEENARELLEYYKLLIVEYKSKMP
jgi:glycosyltransferase involved in cell wall biosynthesis